MRRRLLTALLLLAPGLLPQMAQAQLAQAQGAAPAASPPLVVFAAASLTDALHDIAPLWQARGHAAPSYSFASSSTLARPAVRRSTRQPVSSAGPRRRRTAPPYRLPAAPRLRRAGTARPAPAARHSAGSRHSDAVPAWPGAA